MSNTLKGRKRAKIDRSGPNRLKWTQIDQIWTKWNEVDQVDRIGPNGNKADEIGLNRTEVD